MSNRGRRSKRLSGFLAVFAMLATFLPVLAFTGVANAAAPPVQDITAFCAGGPSGDPFPDVPAGDAFHDEIACAKDAGVVNGKTDGLFHENEHGSRAQVSSIEAREDDTAVSLASAGQTLNPLPAPGSNPFDDVGDPPPNGGPSTAPHTDNILRLDAAGIVQGKSATIFDPSADMTRFQFVKVEVGKIEDVTGTTLDDTCGATFTDGAQNDATFGTFVKKANCAGIIQGKAGGIFDGGAGQTRGQIAAEAMRGMAFMNANGFIDPLHGVPSNQQLNVQPTDRATNPLGTARTYTVSGLAAGNYNIQLFNCGYLTQNQDGSFTFTGTNPNTNTGNNAQTGPTGSAFISSINGAPNTGPINQFQVNPQNGTITFTVNTPASPTNGPGACVRPVVFNGSNGTLELGTNNQPSTDLYGVGGITSFVPTAASSTGNINGGAGVTVQSVDKNAHQFIGCTSYVADAIGPNAGPGTFSGCTLFTYKQTDTLAVSNPYFAQFNTPSSFSTFEKDISNYDLVTGAYSNDPAANSNLVLRDQAPVPVGGLTVAPNAAGSPANNVTLNFNDSATPSAGTYLPFRALATDNGAQANPRFTCPARNIANFPTTNAPATTNPAQPAENDYTLLGAVSDTDPSGATNRVYTFVDTTATSGTTYCYAIVVLDGTSGQISFLNPNGANPFGRPTTAGSSIPGAVAGAPKIQNAMAQDSNGSTIGIADALDVWQFIMNEPMCAGEGATTPCNGSSPTSNGGWIVTVQDADTTPTVGTVTCNGVQANCVLQQADTYNGVTTVKNQVLRVTLLQNPTITQVGTVANLQYPLTIQAVSNTWLDRDEGLPIDLAGSPDKTLEAGTLSPAVGSEKVGLVSGTANSTNQTAVLTYNLPVQCTGAVPGQFVANPGVSGGGQSATSLVCNGTANITLTFPAGTFFSGTAATIVYNQAANQVDRIHKNGQPTVDAVSPDQVTTAPANSSSLTSINPTTGPASGGTTVTLTGTNLSGVTAVNFCGNSVAPTSTGATQVTATTPAKPGITSDLNCAVTVTTPQGTSNSVNFLYTAPPTVNQVSPTGGPTAGGQSVTITGTNFRSGATVTFGGTAATNVVVVDAFTITATTPAHAAGVVNVVVTNTDTQSGTGTGAYTYVTAPVFTAAGNGTSSTTARVFFNEPVCRSAVWAANDWTISGSSSGAHADTADNIPLCNVGNTNGVQNALVTFTGAVTNGETVTVTMTTQVAAKLRDQAATTASAGAPQARTYVVGSGPQFTAAAGQSNDNVTVTFSQAVCRLSAHALGDWTWSPQQQGGQTQSTSDGIPICNASLSNGVTTATVGTPDFWTLGTPVTFNLTAQGAGKIVNSIGQAATPASQQFNDID